MRATLFFLILFSLNAGIAHAQSQAPLDVGSPEAAFAGGPIRLSKGAAAMLRSHYEGDRVPLIPQPFRGKLDTALLGRDWQRAEAVKQELVAARGIVMALAWEQSRFIATGAVGVAEMHALDVAATGSTGLSETAVMLWFYAAAVTLTDGHQCVDEAAKEAHLDRLRGPAFEPVTRIVRSISDDRLGAMRDLAIRLETVLSGERSDDTMCRSGNAKAEVKPEAIWRPEAAVTRAMLPKHLAALAAVMRPRPIARLEAPKPDVERPVVATRDSTKAGRAKVEPSGQPMNVESATSEPSPFEPARAEVATPGPSQPEPMPAVAESSAFEPMQAAVSTTGPPKVGPTSSESASSDSDPTRSEPPNLQRTTPESQADH